MDVRERLARGEFNDMQQSRQPDGSVIITLVKRGVSDVYRMTVRDLYLPAEQVLKQEVLKGGAVGKQT